MIVYHGSNSNFRRLKIAKNLVKHQSTLDNEGLGIYFSTDIEVARSYGKYIYTLEINDAYLYDFRNINVCRKYLSKICFDISLKTGLDISKYIELENVALRMKLGGQAISGVGRELYMLLDSNFEWYQNSRTKVERVCSLLRSYDRNCPKAYMFEYHIKNIGVIKDVSEDIVTIVSKKSSY